ncbi:MAG TPA: hypothetical protein PK640_02190 [Verrucomicrobiota bacterium]|nr:hypothetical protein [Verrucomicrobiota bacterium]
MPVIEKPDFVRMASVSTEANKAAAAPFRKPCGSATTETWHSLTAQPLTGKCKIERPEPNVPALRVLQVLRCESPPREGLGFALARSVTMQLIVGFQTLTANVNNVDSLDLCD